MLEQLEDFFSKLNTLLHPQKIHEPSLSYSFAKFNNFFVKLNSLHQRYIESGEGINIWQISKIGNNEVKNCSVLAWFLNFYGTHGQKELFLDTILKGILTDNERLSYNLTSGYRTKLEESHNEYNEKNLLNRIDFVIENKNFIIFIEAKTISGIGYKQLERYSNLLNKMKGNRQSLFIYLAPYPLLPTDLNQLLIKPTPISWKEISVSIKTSVECKHKTAMNKNKELWQYYALAFAKHIRSF